MSLEIRAFQHTLGLVALRQSDSSAVESDQEKLAQLQALETIVEETLLAPPRGSGAVYPEPELQDTRGPLAEVVRQQLAEKYPVEQCCLSSWCELLVVGKLFGLLGRGGGRRRESGAFGPFHGQLDPQPVATCHSRTVFFERVGRRNHNVPRAAQRPHPSRHLSQRGPCCADIVRATPRRALGSRVGNKSSSRSSLQRRHSFFRRVESASLPCGLVVSIADGLASARLGAAERLWA